MRIHCSSAARTWRRWAQVIIAVFQVDKAGALSLEAILIVPMAVYNPDPRCHVLQENKAGALPLNMIDIFIDRGRKGYRGRLLWQ
jgi:hypothetical protein